MMLIVCSTFVVVYRSPVGAEASSACSGDLDVRKGVCLHRSTTGVIAVSVSKLLARKSR